MPPTTIGAFQVIRELGRGGMGEVYLARDSRLDRLVAIKALPAHLADDPDRLARFQREAKVLASLNHPGIGAIYGLEEAAGHHYLVLEFVEGETLADRLKGGAIPVEETLGLARQIAEALEVAHEKGVVHRDLKPGNVMVTADGAVKVLDFGLARAADAPLSSTGGPPSVNSPTLTSPMHVNSPTIPGVILGTAGYMSPEQARGKAIDKRSDIFSFGCVLYELLTNSQPFIGESVADSLGAIIHRDPDWALLPPSTPTRIAELLRTCLAKDRRNRLHDMGDARLAIERTIEGREWTTTPGSAAPARPRMTVGIAVLVGAAVLVAAAAGWLLATRLAPPLASSGTPAYLMIPSRSSSFWGASNSVISPDGRSIVFSARSTGTGPSSLWVRPLNSFEAKPLPETAGAAGAFWSWDSRSVAFHADGKLWSVDVAQEGSRRLIAAEGASYGASWGSSGIILLARTESTDGAGRLVKIPAAGGTAEPVTTLDPKTFEKSHAWPHFLPDGRRFLYLSITFNPDQEIRVARLYAGSLDSPERTLVGEVGSGAWYVDSGWLVYVDDGTIKAAPFDQQTLRITGDPITIADGVFFFRPLGNAGLSASTNGTIAFHSPPKDEELVWFDPAGARLGTLGPKGTFANPRISPDGTQVVVAVGDKRTQLADLWIYGADRPTATRLTSDARWESAPVWSHDGSLVYFSWDKRDAPEIYSVPVDKPSAITMVYGAGNGGAVWFAEHASPDGKSLLMTGSVEHLGRELRVLSLDGNGQALPFKSTPANESNGRFSPDGQWVAFESNESGRSEVYITPASGAGPKVQVSDRGWRPVWAPAGDKLYYTKRSIDGDADPGTAAGWRIMVVDLSQPGAFKTPPAAQMLFEIPDLIGDFDVTPDGKRFLVQTIPSESLPIRVILNGLPAVPAKRSAP